MDKLSKILRFLVSVVLVTVCLWAIFSPRNPIGKTINLGNNLYEIKASYPVIDGPQGKMVADLVSQRVGTLQDNFTNLQPKDIEIMGLGTDPERRWTLDLKVEIATSSDFTSYIFEKYAYTGGAHGYTGFMTLVYDNRTGKMVELKDLVKGENYIQSVSSAVRDVLYKRLVDTKISLPDIVDAGTAPDLDNFRNFYPTDQGIVFIFSPYAVGPYVLGTQRVEIPFDRLNGQ